MALFVIAAALALTAFLTSRRPPSRDRWLDDMFMNCDRPGGYPPTSYPMFPGRSGPLAAPRGGIAELRPADPAARPDHDLAA